MPKWGMFTSFRHGDHNILFHDDVLSIMSEVEELSFGFEQSWGSVKMLNWHRFSDVLKALQNLSVGENIWVEFEDTTWCTIQRMGI